MHGEPGVEGVEWSRKGGHFEATIPLEFEGELRLSLLLRSWADSQIIYWSAWPVDENADPATWGKLTRRR